MFCERPRRLIRSSRRPALGVGGQRPGLVHRQHRVAVGVGGAEAQGVGGEQAQDARLIRSSSSSSARAVPGQRQAEVADPQARSTWAPPTSGSSAAAVAEAEPGEAGLAVDLDRAADLVRLGVGASRSRRARTSAQLRAPRGGGLGDRRGAAAVCHSGLTGAGRIETRKL